MFVTLKSFVTGYESESWKLTSLIAKRFFCFVESCFITEFYAFANMLNTCLKHDIAIILRFEEQFCAPP